MENNLQIFNNPKFGEIRIVLRGGEPWFVGKDAATILRYANHNDALKKHVDEEDRYQGDGVAICDPMGRIQNPVVINESGLFSLVFGSHLPEAKAFKRWVTSEVLPTLRKTGTYSINPAPKEDAQAARAKAMLLNAKTRAAQTWLKIAAVVNIPEYKQIASTYAANTLAEKEIMQLPKTPAKTYTATEIGNILGVSANKIGKLANANGVKIKEYGIEVWDKSPHSAKQIPSWRYYEKAIPVFRHLLSHETKPLEVVKGGVSQ